MLTTKSYNTRLKEFLHELFNLISFILIIVIKVEGIVPAIAYTRKLIPQLNILRRHILLLYVISPSLSLPLSTL